MATAKEQESIYKRHTPPSGGGDFLKLHDGDKVKLRLLTDPVITVYKQGDRPRYGWLVYNHDAKIVQVYIAGISVYNAIVDLIDEWGDPSEFDITVKRTGSGMNDTSYAVAPVKNSVNPPTTALEEAEKMDLVKMTSGKLLSEYVEDNILPAPKEGPAVTTEYGPADQPEDI